MPAFTPKRIILSSILLLLIGAGGWFYTRHNQRVIIASYVPDSALGYLEINDWPRLVDRFAATKAWQQLAPVFGVDGKLDYIGKAGWVVSFTGGNEAAIFARSQLAIVMTGLEVRGDEVRPRLALIAETHSDADDLRKVIERRLPELARRIYGRETKSTSEYGGVSVISYASRYPDRQLLSAQIESEWILANHPEPLRASIDTRLGRAPSMANNFHLQNARPSVDENGEMFGFFTGGGVSQMLRFGLFLISSNALRGTGIVETLQDVLSDFANRASDGIAYGSSFKDGQVVDRYALLFKSDLVESLKPVIKVNQDEPRALQYIPSSAESVTLINVVDPAKTLDGIEAAISARIGAGQSFLLHQFLLGARGTLLGIKSVDGIQSSLGHEIASLRFARDSQDRVWLVGVRDRQLLSRTIEQYLTLISGTPSNKSLQSWPIRRENFSGVEIIGTNNPRRSSVALIGDYIAIGDRTSLTRFIKSQREGGNLKESPEFASSAKPSQQAAMINLSTTKEESGQMMFAIARWLGINNRSDSTALERLPFSVSSTSLNDRGIYIETHSPFGNFPFFISLADASANP
jgi:hypothetical protein